MHQFKTFNLKEWTNEHRHLLKPPVGNATIWQDTEFIVMVVGGPNARKDYHVNYGEEFYYQLEGDITLRVMNEGRREEIPIREGDIFLLPPRVPHSPQRPAGTTGMVIERKRKADEVDHLRWYCESCNEVLHDTSFKLTDIARQLKPLIESFYANQGLRTCRSCGAVMEVPPAVS